MLIVVALKQGKYACAKDALMIQYLPVQQCGRDSPRALQQLWCTVAQENRRVCYKSLSFVTPTRTASAASRIEAVSTSSSSSEDSDNMENLMFMAKLLFHT